MINLLLGDSGHGKSTHILNMLKDDAANHVHSLLIVPEQQSVATERTIASLLPPSAQLYCDATNFTRLANKIFRKHGGLRYKYATDSIRNLIMYKSLCESIESDQIKHFNIKKGRERTYVKMFIDAIGELKTYGVSISKLEEVIKKFEENIEKLNEDTEKLNEDIKKNEKAIEENEKFIIELKRLVSRLTDVITVWRRYEATLNDSYADSYDDLLLLDEKIKELEKGGIKYFEGMNVYIDSFYSFTKSQKNILSHIFAQAKNVTIALDCPADIPQNEMQYAKIAKTRDELIKNFNAKPSPFGTDYKHKSKEIKYLCENIWRFDALPYGKCETVKLVEASNEFDECEYVASQIKKLILSGERYSSIAVIMRNSDTYRGIINYAFDKYEIPYFLSASTDIMSLPVIKMIFSALKSILTHRYEDIISYIKCGYTDIDDNELYELESYMYRWNIHGKRFLNEDYWKLSPDGYSKKGISPSQEARRLVVLSARKKVMDKLSILENVLTEKESSVEECAKALHNFLDSHNILSKIELEIEENKSRQYAYELSQVWNILMRSIDNLVHICGDNIVSCEEFTSLLSYALDGNTIGSIPVSEDSVIIGDAPTIRTNGIKHAFILGVNEGVFPAPVEDSKFFNDADRDALENVHIELSSKNDIRGDDELLYFKNAISCPSDTLTVSCLTSDINGASQTPSIAFLRLLKLMYYKEKIGKKEIEFKPLKSSDLEPIDRIYTEEVAWEYLGQDQTNIGRAVKKLDEEKNGSPTEEEKKAPKILGFTNEETSIQDVEALLGKRLMLSSSSIESFSYCKFKFYYSHILSLRSGSKISFSANHVGDLNHAVMEEFFNQITKKDFDLSTLDDARIEKMVDKIVNDFSLKLCGSARLSNKLIYLFNKLKRNLLIYLKNLVEELLQCSFKAEFRELKISPYESDKQPSLKFDITDDKSVVITGTIDRVDIFRDTAKKKTYIRIIDYKSGSKALSMNDVENGFGMQLFIYLFALWKLGKSKFKDKLLAGTTDEILPAGIIYFPMDMGKRTVDTDIDLSSSALEDFERQTIEESIKRSGLFLDDDEIIKAQDKENSGKFVPADKKFRQSLDAFEDNYTMVSNIIKEIGATIFSGDASATPTVRGKSSPCNYCELYPICRSKKRIIKRR